MIEKNWVIADAPPQDWQLALPDLSVCARQLLWNRQIRDKAEVERFLHPAYETDLHDPFLFKDMPRAVERIFGAIADKEKIFVYGDYDADGVTGSVIIKSTLDALGAKTGIYMPHRAKEGYGLNRGAVEYMAGEGARVIITNDCGISNTEEAGMVKEQGIDLIITDHHRIPEAIPEAYAILHPLIEGEPYPNKYLTGGGVAFKLAQALIKSCELKTVNCALPEGYEKWLLDLVAISTVADVGILKGENRTLVKYGLIVLNRTRRIGLQKLFACAGIKAGKLNTWNIGWQIAPRINAAGRMDHANTAFALLATESAEDADALALQLNQANQERQKETDRVLKEARELILSTLRHPEEPQGDEGSPTNVGNAHSREILPLRAAQGQNDKTLPYLLAAYNPSWAAGVIGLAAGRLMDEFQKPVIIGTRAEDGKIVASARSIDGFNVVEALANSAALLEKFGGHPKAAGFSVSGEDAWRVLIAHLEKLARQKLHEADIRPSLKIDADVQISEIDWDFVNTVQQLEPYGEGNPQPRFLLHGLRVAEFDRVGKNGAHLRLTVSDSTNHGRKMIGFRCGKWCDQLTMGDLIDVVAEIGVNEWNGNREIEMKIVDLRFHREKTD